MASTKSACRGIVGTCSLPSPGLVSPRCVKASARLGAALFRSFTPAARRRFRWTVRRQSAAPVHRQAAAGRLQAQDPEPGARSPFRRKRTGKSVRRNRGRLSELWLLIIFSRAFIIRAIDSGRMMFPPYRAFSIGHQLNMYRGNVSTFVHRSKCSSWLRPMCKKNSVRYSKIRCPLRFFTHPFLCFRLSCCPFPLRSRSDCSWQTFEAPGRSNWCAPQERCETTLTAFCGIRSGAFTDRAPCTHRAFRV